MRTPGFTAEQSLTDSRSPWSARTRFGAAAVEPQLIISVWSRWDGEICNTTYWPCGSAAGGGVLWCTHTACFDAVTE
jgi:hypothetical protein